MARSTVLNTTKRRKSLRSQNIEPAAVVPVENVARARRRSTSLSSTSIQSLQPPAAKDGPYRRLRNRRPSSGQQEDDCKPPAAALISKTNLQDRKRSTTSGPSTTSSQQSSKKKKGNPRISVSTQSNENPTTHQPLTRRQRQKLNQVTPSPASAKNSAASPAFSFNSPPPKQKRHSGSSLPAGVVDLYPSKSSFPDLTCHCGRGHCSPASLCSSFIQSYGKEYWQIMKDKEEPAIHPPSPASSGARSPIFSSPENSNSASSVLSQQTPDHRRDWVYIDTSNLEVAQPSESTQFLHYQPELTPKMRAILVDWVIELSEHFHFGAETLHLAITLVDKVLACGPLSIMEDNEESDEDSNWDVESKTNNFLISRERFQLLGASCTWLACKIEELSPPSVSEIAYVSDNIYTTEQIKRMERRICTALGFSLIHQTPYPYIYEFMRASNECSNPACESVSSPVFQHLVMYLLELGRLPYAPVTKKPSLLAAAAVYLARVTLGVGSSDISVDAAGRWTRTLQYYTRFSKAELKETVLAIHGYHLAAEDSSLKSVFAKYKHKKFNRVAVKTVPRVEDLGF
jgi:cyclin A